MRIMYFLSTALLFTLTLMTPSNEVAAGRKAEQSNAGYTWGWIREADTEEVRQLKAELKTVAGNLRYEEAIPLAQRILKLVETKFGIDHPYVATEIFTLARLYQSAGNFSQAEPLYKRVLSIVEKGKSIGEIDVVLVNQALAGLYAQKGDHSKADMLFQGYYDNQEQKYRAELQTKNPNIALLLDDFAALDQVWRMRVKDRSINRGTLVVPIIQDKEPDRLSLALELNNLEGVYRMNGIYEQAEHIFRRLRKTYEEILQAVPPSKPTHSLLFYSHSDFGVGDYMLVRQNNYVDLTPLAHNYLNSRNDTLAKTSYLLQLEIDEKSFGLESASIIPSLLNLARLYGENKQYQRAEPFFLHALPIAEKAFGGEHPYVATILRNLAVLHRETNAHPQAARISQQALRILEKAYGDKDPHLFFALYSGAMDNWLSGDYAQAVSLYQRALQIAEKTPGAESDSFATLLNEVAKCYLAQGDYSQAVFLQSRASKIKERYLNLNLISGSEREQSSYLSTFLFDTYFNVSLHASSSHDIPEARNLSLLSILNYKGRVLADFSSSLGLLRRSPNLQDRALLDQWINNRSQLAELALRWPGKIGSVQNRITIKQLEELNEKIEAELGQRSLAFKTQSQSVTIEAVQAALPQDTILLEFFQFRPYDAKSNRWGNSRYVVYVLRHEGELLWVNLGEARFIDQAVAEFRQALRNPKQGHVKRVARALDAKVMQPVRRLLGDAKRFLVSSDGALNLVPFAALVDEQNRYLVENSSFSYLTSGRDLLRLRNHSESNQDPVIIADPDFGELAGNVKGRVVAPSADFLLANAYFTRLESTVAEAQALKAILPRASALIGRQATETALKQVNGPSILHIATHGFFLENVRPDPPPLLEQRLLLQQLSGMAMQPAGNVLAATSGGRLENPLLLTNPLLRSGLGLAGANRRKSGADDGILTALETTGLNLWGTKMVVLSACDTGVGEVKTGDGVYGLRRALVLAGAETQVMSLWPVSDNGTQELMVGYYRALKDGQERGEGMRQVQLSMLKNPRRQHPYYWASFIVSGDWSKLDEKAGAFTAGATTQKQDDDEEKQRDLVNQQLKAARGRAKANPSNRPAPRGKGPQGRTRSIEAEELVGVTIWRLREQTAVDAQNKERVLVQQDKRKSSKQPGKPNNDSPNYVAERVKIDTAFEKDDQMQIGLEVGREAGNYLYVIDRELYADGTMSAPYLIFPSATTPNIRKMISAGKLALVPAQGDPIPYFTLMPSRDNHIGERLTIIVSPTPLKFTVKRESNSEITLQRLDEKEVMELEAKYALTPKSYESKLSLGQLMTRMELAAGKNTRLMVQKDPLPQTIYRIAGSSESPLAFNLDLKMKR